MLGVFGITLNIALLSIAVFFFLSLVREIAPPAGRSSRKRQKSLPRDRKRKIYNSEAKTTKLYNQIQITPHEVSWLMAGPTSARALHLFRAYVALPGRNPNGFEES
jgi:hypothetical protein